MPALYLLSDREVVAGGATTGGLPLRDIGWGVPPCPPGTHWAIARDHGGETDLG
ncbi:MAG: hypothetical protein AB4042_07620 [Leptolyngbyaceae cyanobacterium]